VRSLSEKKIMVCCSPRTSEWLSIDTEAVTQEVIKRVQLGQEHLIDLGLEYCWHNRFLVQNAQFRLYRDHVVKQNLSHNDIDGYLKSILKSHGVKLRCARAVEVDTSVKLALKEAKIENETDNCERIASAPVIDGLQYEQLKKAKRELTVVERLSMRRHKIVKAFDLEASEEMTGEFVKTALPKIEAKLNAKLVTGLTIAEAAAKMHKKHRVQYNRELTLCADDFSTTSGSEDEDDFSEWGGKSVNSYLKHARQRASKMKKALIVPTEGTVDSRLRWNPKWMKIAVCCELLAAAGFERFDQTDKAGKIQPDWSRLREFVVENEEKMRTLWGCKQLVLGEEDWKKPMMKYVNARLQATIGVEIQSTSTKRLYYQLACS